MKVLIVVKRDPDRGLLIDLPSKKFIRAVKGLIDNKRHADAIVSAIAGGRIEKEVGHYEFPRTNADLVLSETSARWDLTGSRRKD